MKPPNSPPPTPTKNLKVFYAKLRASSWFQDNLPSGIDGEINTESVLFMLLKFNAHFWLMYEPASNISLVSKVTTAPGYRQN